MRSRRSRQRGKHRNRTARMQQAVSMPIPAPAEPTKAMLIGSSYLSYASDILQGYGTDKYGDYDIIHADIDPRLKASSKQLDSMLKEADTADEKQTADAISQWLHDSYIPRAELNETSRQQQDMARLYLYAAISLFRQSRRIRAITDGESIWTY